MPVPLLDLRAQHATIRDEVVAGNDEQSSTLSCSSSARRGTSWSVAVAALSHTKYAVGCANGTDALLLALRALDCGPGDEVITTPFTFFATAGTIHNVGARPVFVDIDPDDVQHPAGGRGRGAHAEHQGRDVPSTCSARWRRSRT